MTGRNPKFEWQDAFIQADLTPSEFKVGQAVANRWNGDNNQPYASAEWLSTTTGYSVRQVRRAIAGLREKGWLAQVSRGGRRGDQTWASRFRLTVPNVTPMTPNVTPVSSQRDISVTPVDLPVRPTAVDPQTTGRSNSRADAQQGSDSERRVCWQPCEWESYVGGSPCGAYDECKTRGKMMTREPLEVLKGML